MQVLACIRRLSWCAHPSTMSSISIRSAADPDSALITRPLRTRYPPCPWMTGSSENLPTRAAPALCAWRAPGSSPRWHCNPLVIRSRFSPNFSRPARTTNKDRVDVPTWKPDPFEFLSRRVSTFTCSNGAREPGSGQIACSSGLIDMLLFNGAPEMQLLCLMHCARRSGFYVALLIGRSSTLAPAHPGPARPARDPRESYAIPSGHGWRPHVGHDTLASHVGTHQWG